MDFKNEELPPGQDWSQLTSDQVEVVHQCMRRLAPLDYSTDDVIKDWVVSRKIVFSITPMGCKVFGQVSGRYRLLVEVGTQEIKWWVGNLQWLPLRFPEVLTVA